MFGWEVFAGSGVFGCGVIRSKTTWKNKGNGNAFIQEEEEEEVEEEKWEEEEEAAAAEEEEEHVEASFHLI